MTERLALQKKSTPQNQALMSDARDFIEKPDFCGFIEKGGFMSKQIRSKKSTVANSLATMVSASTAVQPTMNLSSPELIHFTNITNSRESSTWSDNDRAIAGYLAKTYHAMDELWLDIEAEGWVITNDRGTPIMNPKSTALNVLTTQSRSMNHILGISASQKGVSGSVQSIRNDAEINARDIIKKASKDDLLA